jgi:hypothetical protein
MDEKSLPHSVSLPGRYRCRSGCPAVSLPPLSRPSFSFLLISRFCIPWSSKRLKPGAIVAATSNHPGGISRGRHRTCDAQRNPWPSEVARTPLRNTEAVRAATQYRMRAVTIESVENQTLTRFHCSVEWHLALLEGRFTGLIYSFAYRIAGTGGSFHASAINVAEFFHCHRNAVLRSYKQLEQAGFFVVKRPALKLRQGDGRFTTTIYEVLSHKEWARKHPGECAAKETFPWSGEEFSTRREQMGQALYRVTGFRYTAKELNWLCDRAGADDAEILRRAGKMLKDAPGTLSARALVEDLVASFKVA